MGGRSPLSTDNSIIPQLDGNISNISILSQSDNYSQYSEYNCNDNQSELSENSNISSTIYDGEQIPVYISQYRKGLYSHPSIPPPWYEEYMPSTVNKSNKDNIIFIPRDNRLVTSESLPVISVSNLRSLAPKIRNFRTDLIEREISVSLISEIWEKVGCKNKCMK